MCRIIGPSTNHHPNPFAPHRKWWRGLEVQDETKHPSKMIPSKAKLEQAFPGHGAKLRSLLTGDIDPMTYPAVAQWAARCYNTPKDSELVERALDAELGTHGTEAIRGDMWDRFYCDAVAIYLNAGDTYATTLIFDVPARRWIVSDIGSFIERKQRAYGIQ